MEPLFTVTVDERAIPAHAQLVIPSIFGLFVFLYGVATMNSDIPSMDICNSDQGLIVYK